MKQINFFDKRIWMLIAIILAGFFLRTYHFHDWLYFYPDQARDLALTQDVLSGKSSWPLLGPIAASTPFKLGPIYYYFQIISAKIFGATPEAMAYPDLFFGILSIPLLYFFLKKYFSDNLTLALSGLYSLSFYAVRYSRFAWNVNPIPFFTILFLFSLLEFLDGAKKPKWVWPVLLGISLGVGVQLHAVLLVLMPAMVVIMFVYAQKKGLGNLQKWGTVILLALILNGSQIFSEVSGDFSNTRHFMENFTDRAPNEKGGIINSLGVDVVCHAQANILYLSSLENNDPCDSVFSFKNNTSITPLFIPNSTKINISLGFIILIMGYSLMIYYLRKEADARRKMFLSLNLLYGALTFIILLPIAAHNGQVRYLLPVIFMPFLFVGLLWKYLMDKFHRRRNWLGIAIIALLIGTNFMTFFSEARQFSNKSRSNSQYVVLGELELINSYILEQSSPQREVYISGGQKYMQNFYRPLSYVASKNNFTLNRVSRNPREVPAGKPIFFIGQSFDAQQDSGYDSAITDMGFSVESYKNFGNIGVYKLKN